jgi:hypothetical protein
MTEIKIGSMWTTMNGKLFQVVSVAKTPEETWVTYKDKTTSEHFSCLKAAFLQRFRAFENHRYI